LDIDDDTLYFECVATNEADRCQGVAGRMLLKLIETEPYETFALDVVDSNGRAQSVYRKIVVKPLALAMGI
jgi:ribosomal protein S18 acetylase RimI-like enzyme